jgi:hypothetical protein
MPDLCSLNGATHQPLIGSLGETASNLCYFLSEGDSQNPDKSLLVSATYPVRRIKRRHCFKKMIDVFEGLVYRIDIISSF